MDNKCKATTKKGSRCTRNAKAHGLCNQHNPSVQKKAKNSPPLELPRLPDNLSEKLANCSDIGINKIKEQIIKMWLEDGGSYLTLDKYNNRIPVALDVYQELIKRFNGEEIVVQRIFVTESIPKPEKPKVYGYSTPPMVPIGVEMYANFIPNKKDIKTLNKTQEKAFKKLQDFIFTEWKKLGQPIHEGMIYLTLETYNGASKFIRNKFQEVNDKVFPIEVDYWFNYFMSRTFRIGEKQPRAYKPEDKPNPKPKIKTVSAPPKPQRSITYQNFKTELQKIFKDKDIDVFINVIQTNSNLYPIKSKGEIHKLYMEYHPDKCDTDSKVVKLCNVFCAKMENIKKLWNYKNNPALSPPKILGNDIESVLKILNNEV